MSQPFAVVGIDPGLVHTGLVLIQLFPDDHSLRIREAVVEGIDVEKISLQVTDLWGVNEHIVIESFRTRSNFAQDDEMRQGVTLLKSALPNAQLLDNMGVKQVVKPDLMKLLGVWNFATRSNHQDLRSAARIALLYMLKLHDFNTVLASIVEDHLKGETWKKL